jgi:hypothetical protein
MRSSQDYRRYAAECQELATSVSDPQVRSTLHHMAGVWLRLAEQKEGVYRRNAADCLSLATTTDDPQTRVALARMAEDWLRLADQEREADDTSKTAE